MRKQFQILICLVSSGTLIAGTPTEFTLGLTGGYDSNVLRFSAGEVDIAAHDLDLMGGATTFDSFVYKLGSSFEKTLFQSGEKEFLGSGSLNWSDYRHSQGRKYWSGGLDAVLKWGPYQNMKYSVRHLDSYYLRHYIDRDISASDLTACAFSDRRQFITLTQRFGRRQWASISIGYLQRYYDRPFTEFDLDINYLRGKINKRIPGLGTVSLQVERGTALNRSFRQTAKASSFDRSYETLEWFIPIRVNRSIPFFSEIGASIRQETRSYAAESEDDPLHLGRSHQDRKYDLWAVKRITDEISLSITTRYRTRTTDSGYEWVEDLKSFQLLQLWCKIEWDLFYDRY